MYRLTDNSGVPNVQLARIELSMKVSDAKAESARHCVHAATHACFAHRSSHARVSFRVVTTQLTGHLSGSRELRPRTHDQSQR